MTNYGSKFERLDPGALARGLARHAEAFCRHWFPEGRKVGNYWQMADISGAKGRSLTIRLKSHGSRQAGKWTDHQNGDHGDLLDLLHYHLEPVAYPDLLRQAADYLGEAPVIPDDGTSDYEPAVASNRQAAAGRRLFSYGRPIRNTLADAYLRGRGIARFGPALAFHPNVYLRAQDGTRLEIPALLAAITDNAGTVTGCSRVFLNARTGGLAAIEAPKRVLGRLHGNAIRFGETSSLHRSARRRRAREHVVRRHGAAKGGFGLLPDSKPSRCLHLSSLDQAALDRARQRRGWRARRNPACRSRRCGRDRTAHPDPGARRLQPGPHDGRRDAAAPTAGGLHRCACI